MPIDRPARVGRYGLAVCLLLFAGAISSPALAQADRASRPMLLGDSASITLLDEAREHIFGLRLGEADRALYELARRPDGAPAAHFHLALGSLMQSLIEDREESYERFFERSDSLRDVLKKAPEGTWRSILEAETDFQRLVAWAKRGHYVRAAMAGAAAFGGYEEVLERDPDNPDVLKGAGLFHALIGALPSTFRRFLSILGFGGSFDQGIRELAIAAERSRYMSEEASIYLGMFDLFELPVPIDAVEVYGDLYRRHDSSPLVAMPYLEALMRVREVETADSVLATMRERTDSGEILRVEYFTWFEGESAFRRGDFAVAADRFARYVRVQEGAALKAMAWLRLGLAYDLTGRRDEAVAAYRAVTTGREFDEDAVATRRAMRLLEMPPDPWERRLIEAANAFDRNDFETADALLAALRVEAALPARWAAEVLHRSGRLREEEDRDDEALSFFTDAIRRGGDPLGRWVPLSWYRISVLEEAAGRKDSAVAALRALLEVDGEYDFRPMLRRRAEVALERLK